jgi:hypothetical protein
MRQRALTLTAVALLLTGCADWFSGRHYDRTEIGELKGKLVVEWVTPDNFLFIPDPENPLTFRRKNNEVIQPERMYTDGGSVPAALRAIKSYSPWGYAPAFILHDWLFVMHHCKVPGYEDFDLDKAATIMAEAMKTIMENPKYGGPNKLVHYSMYEGVRSKAAADHWDNGKCDTPTGPRSVAGPANARSEQPMAAAVASDEKRPRFVIEF